MRDRGPGSPGAVAHACKVLEPAPPLPALHGVSERREVAVRTAFGDPVARDAFELVLRVVTGERDTLDAGVARPERERAAERFAFALAPDVRRATAGSSNTPQTDQHAGRR